MSTRQISELKKLLAHILADANGDQEQLSALQKALADNVPVPCPAVIAG